MCKNPRVSVIIPAYNAEKYIGQCLESVIGQTCRDIEIICVNDGSADRTRDVIQSYMAKDDRITLIDQKKFICRNGKKRRPSYMYRRVCCLLGLPMTFLIKQR